jgi:hypothetical protein
MNAQTLLFVRLLMKNLLTNNSEETCKSIFQRLLHSNKNNDSNDSKPNSLKESLILFFVQEELNGDKSGTTDVDKLYKQRSKMAKKLLEKNVSGDDLLVW